MQLFLRHMTHVQHVQQERSDNSSASLYCIGVWAALSPLYAEYKGGSVSCRDLCR